MKPIAQQVLDQMPPVPLDTHIEYSGSKMVIFEPKLALSAYTTFDCYEFVIPHDVFPPVKIESNKYTFDCNKVFPVNPGQYHGCEIRQDMPCRYLALFIGKSFIQEIVRSIHGKSEIFFTNESFSICNDLKNQIQLFMRESNSNQTGSKLMADSLSIQIAVNLLRQVKNDVTASGYEREYSDSGAVNRVIEFFREYYYGDYSYEYAAKLANLSPYHFIRVFKAHTGKTPYEYLINIRIEKAQELLRSKLYTVTEVCFLSGFKNLSHFTTVFKKKIGVSPSMYRKIIL